ncbi:MAG: transcription-repair coupling factor [Pseudomonadota bacterium]
MSTHAAKIAPGAVTVCGAPEGWDAKLLAELVERTSGPVLHIARDDARAEAMADALAVFAPGLPVIRMPAWDCLPYDRVSPNPEISAARMAALAALAHGWDRQSVVLTTLNAATQKVPARASVADASFIADVDYNVDIDGLVQWLTAKGFNRTSTVIEHGDFAVRGGIIDIFPPGQEHPVRLDFFGDVLDGARRFDSETQRTIEKIGRVELSPASEVVLDPAAVQRFRSRYRETFGAARPDDPLYAAVSEGRKYQGMEHWVALFHERMETLFDYLPDAAISMDYHVEEARAVRLELIEDYFAAREESGTTGEAPYQPCPPKLLYLDDRDWDAALDGRMVRRFTPMKLPLGPGVIDAGTRPGRSFAPERQRDGVNLFEVLVDHIKAKRKQSPVVVASYSEGARDRLQSLLADHGLDDTRTIARWFDLSEGVNLMIWALEAGFVAPDVTVISEQDVFGDRLIRRARKPKRAENFLTETQSLTVGDLVVHIEHGVGRYQGLETVTAMGAPHECLRLEYHGGDKLFLPVENIELLSRYGHESGELDRLGGGAWQAKKARLKKRVLDMADKLIRIAAERMLRTGEILEPDPSAFERFCARFPYQETDDQFKCIGDVLEDMASGRPMDRLICGDVGFGKTEVALRAALVAAQAGLQVAVVAPTTLLARQHAKNFADRFQGTGLRVRQLSRFVPAKEAAETRRMLQQGEVSIVVGTHALLAKSVKFCNLGLLVIDEEQHFGVQHKERLKQLRSDVHVLTMTATPIPRTLQLAISGVRELSIIATPPVDRLAVRTYVSPFDTVTVREALLRERYRGGQAFMVCPRIADLAQAEEWLREQVPEVSYVVAHGQMAAGELDDKMNAFYDGKYDLLLSTTIVESGLDIPTANTLIVQRSDMFGLAQLYQLRGRVGRSKQRAYAYLTTEPRKPLTPQAERRLKVLGSLDTLGAGFTLASHDLDIRGAGNLLGEEQSGHIKEVGFELYQEMLEEAIAKIRAGEIGAEIETDDGWAPQLNLGVPVLIPEDYVTDLDVRLGLYRRLSSLETKTELEGFAAELHDRFGKPPKDVETLLAVVRIKTMCRRAGVERLDTGPKGATIQFRGNKFADPVGLVGFINAQNGLAKVKDNKLIVRRDWTEDRERVRGAFAIARDLARIAKDAKKAA